MKFLVSDRPGMDLVLLNQAEASMGIQVGERPLYVHDKWACENDETCVIHKPSDHHMKDWPLNWRGDTGVMERLCSHGTGHPDPDAMAFEVNPQRIKQYAQHLQGLPSAPDEFPFGYYVEEARARLSAKGVHGCDGCCVRPEVRPVDLINESYNR